MTTTQTNLATGPAKEMWPKIKDAIEESSDRQRQEGLAGQLKTTLTTPFFMAKGAAKAAVKDVLASHPVTHLVQSSRVLWDRESYQEESKDLGRALSREWKALCEKPNQYVRDLGSMMAETMGEAAVDFLKASPEKRAESLGSLGFHLGLGLYDRVEVPGIPGENVPYGFPGLKKFARMSQVFRKASGDAEAVVGMRGSAATGVSFRTGLPFRAESDFDFFIISDKLHQEAVKNGASTYKGALPVWETEKLPRMIEAGEKVSQKMDRDSGVRIFSSDGFKRFEKYHHIIQGKKN